MDKEDIKILGMLKDGKRVADIAKVLHLTRQALYYRIQKLKKEIKMSETITANFEKLGLSTMTLVLIKWRMEQYEKGKEFLDNLSKNPHTCFMVSLLGEWDHAIIFATSSMSGYRLLTRKLWVEGGQYIDKWQTYPISDVLGGGVCLPDLENVLSEKPR